MHAPVLRLPLLLCHMLGVQAPMHATEAALPQLKDLSTWRTARTTLQALLCACTG